MTPLLAVMSAVSPVCLLKFNTTPFGALPFICKLTGKAGFMSRLIVLVTSTVPSLTVMVKLSAPFAFVSGV